MPCLLLGKQGRGQQPIFALKIPSFHRYGCRHFNNGWGRVQSSLWHFMRIQSQFINLVNVEVLPPYMPSQEEKQDPRLFADNVRRWGASTASSRRFLANLLSIVWPELTRLSYYGVVGHAHLQTSSQIALSSIGIKGAAPSDALGLHDRVASNRPVCEVLCKASACPEA